MGSADVGQYALLDRDPERIATRGVEGLPVAFGDLEDIEAYLDGRWDGSVDRDGSPTWHAD